MRVKIQTIGDSLSLSATARGQQKLSSDEYQKIADAGMDIIQTEAKRMVRTKAARQTGKLEESIDYDKFGGTAGGIGASLGWKQTPVSGKRGWTQANAGTGRSKRRKVTTVDDYARILEYSSKRQLRHAHAAFDAKENEAVRAMEKAADAMIRKLVK